MSAADKVNILVVDDLPENHLVLGAVLEDLGENVVTARSGQEALQLVLAHEFAVILLDVNMPDMDGYETAGYIRKRRKSAHTPIIFITAYADEIREAQGYSLGAVDYILTPVLPDILRSKVRVFVELFRMTQEAKRSADERVALAREQAARATAEAALRAAEETTRRATFLAKVSSELAASLDYQVIAGNLARLVVPFLADLSAVTLAGETGATGLTESAWRDHGSGTLLSQGGADRETGIHTASGWTMPASLAGAVARVLKDGKKEFPQNLTEHGSRTIGENAPPGAVDSMPTCFPFPLHATVVLPLRARLKTLGVLSLGMGPSGRPFHSTDLELAEDLADRAAVFLENAYLYRDIQDADRRKNEFLSMLAHELRNPMAPIRNAVEILRATDAPGTELQWVRDVIERNVNHLVRLVNDLLDISRISQGVIPLQMEHIEVAAIVAQAVEISRPVIDARKHELSVSLPQEPLWLNGDETRLGQVLANLLNNAAKFTQPGGKIWLTVEREPSQIAFRVRDSGIGISPDMLSKIFELFMQVDGSLDRTEGGLGIGLTLVRRLVEMHHGSVQASSSGLGKGSEFVVRLPLLKTSPATSEQPGWLPNGVAQETKDGISATRPFRRVLVVDDNRDSNESLATLLKLNGHQVETAEDGPAALTAARAFHPEIVFLDIGLPKMNGYDVAKRLRQEPGLNQMSLIAMTGYGQEADRRRSQEAGFDGHMVKPADPIEIEKLLAAET